MAKKFIDISGLTYVFSKIKTYVSSAISTHNGSSSAHSSLFENKADKDLSNVTDDALENIGAAKSDLSNFNGTIPISKGGTGATTADGARTNLGITPENIGAAKSDYCKLRTYTSLEQLGLSEGSETIAGIVQSMDDNSMLTVPISESNNSIYPSTNGTMMVVRVSSYRTMFFFSDANTGVLYDGNYYGSTGSENWSGWTSYLPLSGGTLTGNLDFQKANNGHGGIYKNHSSAADYGMVIHDEDSAGKTAKLNVSAGENSVFFTDNNGTKNDIYGEHNEDLLKENIAHNQRLYTDLSQIGLTVGSETIADISAKLPTYSRLVLTVGSTNNLTIYPNSNYGLLVVEKTINSRIIFTFTNNQGSQWIGSYAISSSGDTWTDWKLTYNTNFISYGTTDLVAGSTALANGKIYFVYE